MLVGSKTLIGKLNKSTVGQTVILRHRFKMAANRKGIFLNTTININTYLVTWNFIDEKIKKKEKTQFQILLQTMFSWRMTVIWTLNQWDVT